MWLKGHQIAYSFFLFFLLEWRFYWTSFQQTAGLAKKKSLPNLLNCVTLLSVSQPQFNMWGVLLPSSHTTARLLACGNVLAWQMSRPSLASRHGSLLSTSTKELASFHLCPNTGLDLFFRKDTVMIYFSGPSGKVPRWETALVVMLYSELCYIQSYADSNHQLGVTRNHSSNRIGCLCPCVWQSWMHLSKEKGNQK